MANEGAAVVVDYIDKGVRADETIRRIETAGGRTIGVESDVSDQTQYEFSWSKPWQNLEDSTSFVNNAGLEFKHPFLEFPMNMWHKVIEVDLGRAPGL